MFIGRKAQGERHKRKAQAKGTWRKVKKPYN